MRANKPHFQQVTITGIFTAILLLLLVSCGGDPAGSGFTTSEGSNFSISCGSPFAGPGCDDSGNSGVFSTRPTCGTDDDAGIVDACGVAITAVDLHDPVVMTMTGLTANTPHIITIKNPSDVEITPSGFIATSDADGEINKATIVQNMAALPGSELGDYTVSVATQATPGTEVQSLTYTLEDRSRVQCTDAGGTAQASFLTSDNVYATVSIGGGSLADGTYDVYIQDDQFSALATGLSLGTSSHTVDVVGGTGLVNLGTHAIGAYDVIVDVNADGNFDQGTDLISRHDRLHPCFAVQAASAMTVVPEQIASDKTGNKRDIFDPDSNIPAIRDVQASLTPAKRSLIQTPGSARTYLVPHQDTWTDGDAITPADAGNPFKTSPIQNLSNSEAPWLLTPLSSLASLGGTTCYDVVIDTDSNGVFDAGTDYVDNIDQAGDNTTCGVRISTSACNQVTITSHADGTYFATETAVTLEGTILNTPDKGYLTITSGTQSNTIEITPDLSGNYSVDLPLFAGDNYITVSGIYADNSSCSKTITLSRPTNVALFRAQLTWETVAGDYDMDLHLVKPAGTYANGGGGDGTDCNYANCKVGLDGSLSPNGVDWGVTDIEEDDPSLDVDCISNCDRIENIWMSNISEDGDYKVYVDAWNAGDIGENVTVSIFILGTRVAQVNCGHMESGTAEDSCFVGTISWTGGSAGTGTFTPDGTTATTFP